MTDGLNSHDGLPRPRLGYDAAVVDQLIEVFKSELAQARQAQLEALARAERAEQALLDNAADAALVGRAIKLVQESAVQFRRVKAALEPPHPDIEMEEPLAVAPRGSQRDADDDFLEGLRRSLEDDEPLGPREEGARDSASDIEVSLWPEVKRWPRPRVRAWSAATWAVLAVGAMPHRRR